MNLVWLIHDPNGNLYVKFSCRLKFRNVETYIELDRVYD